MKIEEMIEVNRADCSGCEACANICPKNAITMVRDAEGFAYPKINRELCIKCGQCDATCPALNFKEKTIDALPPTFAAIHPDDKILRHSSSGGAFTALSEIILRDGGIIFGAGFDKNWRVVHTSAKNLDELENLRGSKYVQSQIGDIYRQVRDALKGKKVLFSGTPCQCAGLKHFLGKDYDNLLTVDLICHGVPSPAVWESYLAEISKGHEIAHINFRSKRNGWANFCIEFNFYDCAYHSLAIEKNLYGKLFLRNLTLRPSCHGCKFRFPNGQADLTLGDAWGIQNFAPEMFDNRGVSVIFVHTDKGAQFFEQTTLIKRKVNFGDAVSNNHAFMIPLHSDARRENFFAELSNTDDKSAVMEKYFYQDDIEILREIDRQNLLAFMRSYHNLAAQIRQKFERNILVLSSTRNKNEQNILGDFFEKHFPNCGVYLLQSGESEPLTCTEYFSTLATDLKENAAALSDFVRQFNITEIYVENPIQVYIDRPPKFNLSVVLDCLKSCGLPVQTFSQKAE